MICIGLLLHLPAATEEEIMLKMQVEYGAEPAAEVSFVLYEEEDQEEPLKDEADQIITCRSDEDGVLAIDPAYDGYYLQMMPLKGYHLNREKILIEDGETISLKQLNVFFRYSGIKESDEAVSQLKEKNGTKPIAVLKDDQPIGKYLEEGKDYIIKPVSLSEGLEGETVSFHAGPEEKMDVVMVLSRKASYVIRLSEPVRDAELVITDQNDPSLVYAIALDESGMAAGKLPPGRYDVSLKIRDEAYYDPSSAFLLQLEEKKENELIIPVEKAYFTTRFNDASAYTVHVYDQEGREIDRFINDGSAHRTAVRREQDYYIHCDPGPGMRAIEDAQIHTGRQPVNLELTSSLFTTGITVVDEAGNGLAGAVISIQREADGSVMEFVSTGGMTDLNSLMENEIYTAVLSSVPEGWQTADPIRFTAGRENVRFVLKRYVKQTIQVDGGSGTVSYQGYADPDCTIPLRDLNGKDVLTSGTDSFALPEGIYYFRQTGSEPGYYTDAAVHALEVRQEEGVNQTAVFARVPVKVKLEAHDENGQVIRCPLILKAEDGTEQEVSSGDELQLEAGKTYALRTRSAPEGYLDGKTVLFTVADHAPEEVPTAAVKLTSFCDLTIRAVSSSQGVEAGYALYSDPACTRKVMDLDGLTAEGKSDEKGIFRRKLARGTYYLKQTETDPHYFLDQEVYELVLAKPVERKELNSEPVSFRTIVKDEADSPVYGAVFSLLDENRKQVLSWTSDGSIQSIAHGDLMAGKVFYIQCHEMPEGYVKNDALIRFEMPSGYDEETPLISLKAEKRTGSGKTYEVKQPDMEEVLYQEKKKAYWLGAAGLGVVLAGLLVYRKCKKCKKINKA
jgi:hypothetical protein